MDVGTSRSAGMRVSDTAANLDQYCRSVVPGAIRGEDAAPTVTGRVEVVRRMRFVLLNSSYGLCLNPGDAGAVYSPLVIQRLTRLVYVHRIGGFFLVHRLICLLVINTISADGLAHLFLVDGLSGLRVSTDSDSFW